MPLDAEEMSVLIGQIYACALEPERWLTTLERLAGHFGARSCAMYDRGPRGVSYHCEWGSTSGARQEFAARHMRQSPLLTMGWHFEVDTPITLADFMQPEELRQTKFYRDWLAPQGWFDFIAVILAKSAERISVVMFLRPEAADPPGARDKALLRLLSPHLRRALEIQGALNAATARAANLAAALDLVPTPILLFDAVGICLEANAAAGQFLARSSTLRLAGGELRSSGMATERVIFGALEEGILQPATLAFDEADGRRFIAHVLPLAVDLRDRLTAHEHACAAMFIQEIGVVQPMPGEVLVKLYGLTPAETRVVGLIGQGFSVSEAAVSLGITMTTARSHMRNLFTKTGTRRQAELLRLTLSSLPRAAAGTD